jgi:hypothetical protein
MMGWAGGFGAMVTHHGRSMGWDKTIHLMAGKQKGERKGHAPLT